MSLSELVCLGIAVAFYERRVLCEVNVDLPSVVFAIKDTFPVDQKGWCINKTKKKCLEKIVSC